MEGYRDVYLMGRANYMSPCNSIAGLYFEGTCDIIIIIIIIIIITSYQLPWQRTGSTKTSTKF